MKKIILSILILSLGFTALAQGKKDDRRDDRRYDDKRYEEKRHDDRRDDRRYEEKKPAPIAVHKPAPKPAVVVHKPAPAPIVVHKPAPKPEPVKFVVKKEKPKKTNPWKAFVRAVLAPPPPPRAVVVVHSASTPVYEMQQLDRQPQLIESPSITYPENMANAGISGEVTMEVQIDKNGYLGLERVISSTNEEFEREAIASLNTFKYEQALRNGRPVNARFTLTIPFEISE